MEYQANNRMTVMENLAHFESITVTGDILVFEGHRNHGRWLRVDGRENNGVTWQKITENKK